MSVSQNPGSVTATTSTPVTVTGRSVLALRWYMRIAGGLLLLFMMIPGDPESTSLFSYIANHGPYMAPALAAIVGSVGRRVNWLLGVVLTLMWCILDYIFIFGGPNGPGLLFEIVGAVIAVIGIVIAGLLPEIFENWQPIAYNRSRLILSLSPAPFRQVIIRSASRGVSQ